MQYLVNTWVQRLIPSQKKVHKDMHGNLSYNMNKIYRDDILREITEMQ